MPVIIRHERGEATIVLPQNLVVDFWNKRILSAVTGSCFWCENI
jgi:hypothetical protein